MIAKQVPSNYLFVGGRTRATITPILFGASKQYPSYLVHYDKDGYPIDVYGMLNSVYMQTNRVFHLRLSPFPINAVLNTVYHIFQLNRGLKPDVESTIRIYFDNEQWYVSWENIRLNAIGELDTSTTTYPLGVSIFE